MSQSQTEAASIVSGVLSKDEVSQFLTPIVDFTRIGGNKGVIRFGKNEPMVIKSINDGKNIVSYINWKQGSFENFTVLKDSKAPIYELGEFLSLAKIFSDGFQFTLDLADNSINVVSTVNADNSFKYRISDESVCNVPPEVVNTSKLVSHAVIAWSSTDQVAFMKGIHSLKHPHVIFEGKEGENTVSVVCTDNSIKTSYVKTLVKTNAPNAKAFKVILAKDNLLNILLSSVHNFKIALSDKVAIIEGESHYHTVSYFVSTLLG